MHAKKYSSVTLEKIQLLAYSGAKTLHSAEISLIVKKLDLGASATVQAQASDVVAWVVTLPFWCVRSRCLASDKPPT